jgi:hypothetical protein
MDNRTKKISIILDYMPILMFCMRVFDARFCVYAILIMKPLGEMMKYIIIIIVKRCLVALILFYRCNISVLYEKEYLRIPIIPFHL